MEGGAGVRRLQERTPPVARDPLEQHLLVGGEKHHPTQGPEEGKIFRPGDDAAARGDDQPGLAGQGSQRGGFQAAEVRLAFGGEDFRDRPASLLDDLFIGIDPAA